MNIFGKWIEKQNWSEIYDQKDAHLKAEKLQLMLLNQLDICLPEKILKVNENDKPWTNMKIKKIDRRRKGSIQRIRNQKNGGH